MTSLWNWLDRASERRARRLAQTTSRRSVLVGVGRALVAVLEKVNLPIDLLNQNLGRMAKERIESPKLAKIFLKEHPEVWHAWVSDDAAKKIDAAL